MAPDIQQYKSHVDQNNKHAMQNKKTAHKWATKLMKTQSCNFSIFWAAPGEWAGDSDGQLIMVANWESIHDCSRGHAKRDALPLKRMRSSLASDLFLTFF